MNFCPLELSKKLQALGCVTASYFRHFIVTDKEREVSVIAHFSEWGEFKEKSELFSIDINFAYCLEDFVLNNEHCRGNWKKVLGTRLTEWKTTKVIEMELISLRRHDMIDAEDPWKYLEGILK